MGQRSNYAALKDVSINRNKEECAEGMVRSSKNAAVKDVQIKPRLEEYALDMGHR